MYKMDRNQPIANHKPWPFEPVKVNFSFLRGPQTWLMAVKNTNISWFFNFIIGMFLKSTVTVLTVLLMWAFLSCRILWKKNKVAETEAISFSIFYNNSLYLFLILIASFYVLRTFNPAAYPWEFMFILQILKCWWCCKINGSLYSCVYS